MSCQKAAGIFAALPRGANILTPHGTTPFVMQRKDRVTILRGEELLSEFRLSPTSTTRRVVAICCNTPMFLEFQAGHWLSLYAAIWPEGQAPAPQMRTMTKDLPDPASLPTDIVNAKTQNARFMWKLLTAWIVMGFRAPRLASYPPLPL